MFDSDEKLSKRERQAQLLVRLLEDFDSTTPRDSDEPRAQIKVEQAVSLNGVSATTCIKDFSEITGLPAFMYRKGRGLYIPSARNYFGKQKEVEYREKKLIGHLASWYLSHHPDFACCTLMQGTTTASLARALASLEVPRGYYVVTPSIAVAEEMRQSGDTQIRFIGGRYVHNIHACVGLDAVREIERYSTSHVCIGASGLKEFILTHHDPAEISLSQAAVRMADRTEAELVVLATSSKFKMQDAWEVVDLSQLRGVSKIVFVVDCLAEELPDKLRPEKLSIPHRWVTPTPEFMAASRPGGGDECEHTIGIVTEWNGAPEVISWG